MHLTAPILGAVLYSALLLGRPAGPTTLEDWWGGEADGPDGMRRRTGRAGPLPRPAGAAARRARGSGTHGRTRAPMRTT